ncbi:MAG: TetR family transcriptional regulator C-terminal domain-containing protein [Cypionkella sp.]
MLKPKTRIQERNSRAILDAGLEVFSANGFRGATLDQIAEVAGLSKPNLLYYFPSKDAVYLALLEQLLRTWLDPLVHMDPEGEPVEEVLAYVRRKLELARDFPREGRLFANEILQGAPHLMPEIAGPLKTLVDEKSALLTRWMDEGRIARLHPVHLIFSVWSLTQHYADFDVQVRAVLGPGHDPFVEAGPFLEHLFRKMLSPP